MSTNYSVVVASDAGGRDGVGVEVSLKNELILEIFRDDTKKKREVTLYQKNLDLELIEESIEKFKKEVPWEFQD